MCRSGDRQSSEQLGTSRQSRDGSESAGLVAAGLQVGGSEAPPNFRRDLPTDSRSANSQCKG